MFLCVLSTFFGMKEKLHGCKYPQALLRSVETGILTMVHRGEKVAISELAEFLGTESFSYL